MTISSSKLVGIFTAGKNGSTLLMGLLDGSPELWVHPVEVNHLSVFSDLSRNGRLKQATLHNATTRKPLSLGGNVRTDLLIGKPPRGSFKQIQEINGCLQEKGHTIGFDPLEKIREAKSYSAEDFLLIALESVEKAYRKHSESDPQYYAFKTLETPYIEDYDRVFTGMRFIHLIRDPYLNYESLKRNNINKKWTFWRHGGDELKMFLEDRWIPHARYIAQLNLRNNVKHFLIKYEDLCLRPEKEIAKIHRWLDIDVQKELPVQTTCGGRRISDLPLDLRERSGKKGIMVPERVIANMSQTYQYEHVLSKRETEFIRFRTQEYAHSLYDEFDEKEKKSLKRSEIGWKWFFPDKWEIKNVRFYDVISFVKSIIQRRWYIFSKLISNNRYG